LAEVVVRGRAVSRNIPKRSSSRDQQSGLNSTGRFVVSD